MAAEETEIDAILREHWFETNLLHRLANGVNKLLTCHSKILATN